jgi:mannosyltransferase
MLIPDRTGPAATARSQAKPWVDTVPPELVILLTLVLVGAIVRLATLTSQSFWVDEATTAHEMRLSLGGLLHSVRVDETTPPLYFVLAWLWTKVFGAGEVGLRSFSALLGIGLIPLGYLCGRELVSRRAGLVVAALTALSPFMVWYSQEARAYMLLAVFAAGSFLFCARAWREPSTRNIAGWAVLSALALLIHFFAGFLVASEALLLLYSARNRAVVVAATAVTATQLAVLPLALSDTSHPLGWINAFPLSIRIQQVPVDLGLSSLYQSSLVTHGLLGAGLLAAIVVALLVAAGERAQRRGAAFAAGLAGVAILVPLLLAPLGHDYVVPRNFMAAWIPLAVVLGAACTVPRARLAGGALAGVLLLAFLYAGTRIDSSPQYQRPDWRGVAQALGSSPGSRAIVAYDGGFAAQPLAIYLPGIPWQQPGPGPVSVSEVDVVGSPWQATPSPLPAGTKLIGTRSVSGFLVARFSLSPAWQGSPSEIGRRATALLGPAPPLPAVLIQRPST